MKVERTAEEFKEARRRKSIVFWNMHDCSICGYPCGFRFDADKVYYDSGCYCVTYGPNIQPRTWDDVANQYNIQTNEKVIEEYDEFWGFNDGAEV